MITNYSDMKARGIPFWDEAKVGHQCGVPCWPDDGQHNALDCETEQILIGVRGPDGLFRAEESVPFNPAGVIWTCGAERNPSLKDVSGEIAPVFALIERYEGKGLTQAVKGI